MDTNPALSSWDQPPAPLPVDPIPPVQPPENFNDIPETDPAPPVSPPSEPSVVSTPPPPPTAKTVIKPVVLALIIFLVLVSGVAALTFSGRLSFLKKAANGDYCDPGSACPAAKWGERWSTCDGSRRWGCDERCNIDQSITQLWCENGQNYKCENSQKVPSDTGPCSNDATGACAGKEKKSYCDSVGNGDGSTSVLNCTDQEQQYKCQTNHSGFNNPTSCNAAEKTDVFTGESTLVVQPGQSASCSVSSGGNCDISQADIRDNGTMASGLCWDISKNCTNCTAPILTPTATVPPTQPTATVTVRPPTATASPTGMPGCLKLEAFKVANGTRTLLNQAGLNGLRAGDQVQLEATVRGPMQDAVILVKKDGTIIHAEPAPFDLNDKVTYTFTISSPGNYEILGFVKNGGVWQ